ncbi:MAG: hypothetical protein IMZ61_03505 [Planctomycetes bacterium]|nr:hypothetical protein [Planctomycetota bacterium]
MPQFTYHIAFSEDESNQDIGFLELDEPLPFRYGTEGGGFYRPGKITLDGYSDLDIVLYHSQAMAEFMYIRSCEVDQNLLEIVGLSPKEIRKISAIALPGQLCMGSARTKITRQAIQDVFGCPVLDSTITKRRQQDMAIYPIAREGLKYQVAEAIFENYGYYCDEVVLDAHHVFDSSVPVYNRKVEMTVFKDKDLDKQQKENISVAFIADSIASGMVMKETIDHVKERFDHIQQVEVISPLATVRGLCRIAKSDANLSTRVRVHVFETLLNALPPDYYYSAHFDIPGLHIRADMEKEYREWWGKDANGNFIADTACAGYGWSEVFYSPRKQIQMMNSQLQSRHHLTIADIIRRNINLEPILK